ncbi:MAG: RNA methyltransferase [Gemmatales bacterium]|nr:RNA methyltransferase [Gemmatales bacterium]MDW8223808.1 RNA methyltransferase [Gemmatales bacterium]
MSNPTWLELLRQQVRVVLVRPSIAGNIGATARIMRNFAVEQLYLVRPHADPLDLEARKLSTQGEGILRGAQSVADLSEAVNDCGLVLATSADIAGLFRRDMVIAPREAARRAWALAPECAIAWVFGPEQCGLINQEINRCHFLVHIPADPGYPVLNLAQAVAVCLYEQYQAASEGMVSTERRGVASWQLQERMFQHLQQALEEIHFLWGDRAHYLMRGLRNIIGRSAPSKEEVDMLMGLARQIRWYAHRYGPPVSKLPAPESDDARSKASNIRPPESDSQQSGPGAGE